MKFIVETIEVTKHIYVVEAESPDEASRMTGRGNDNWHEYLGAFQINIEECSDSRLDFLKKKQFYCDHVTVKKDNGIAFLRPDGSEVQP